MKRGTHPKTTFRDPRRSGVRLLSKLRVPLGLAVQPNPCDHEDEATGGRWKSAQAFQPGNRPKHRLESLCHTSGHLELRERRGTRRFRRACTFSSEPICQNVYSFCHSDHCSNDKLLYIFSKLKAKLNKKMT